MTTILGAPWPDAVGALVALIGAPLLLVALFQTRSALSTQNRANDLQTVLALWAKLDEHWQRFRDADEGTRHFEFGQLSGYYELACQLFRSRTLTTNAAQVLEEHLTEILPRMREHPAFASLFDDLQSSEKTFENIRWFCHREPSV